MHPEPIYLDPTTSGAQFTTSGVAFYMCPTTSGATGLCVGPVQIDRMRQIPTGYYVDPVGIPITHPLLILILLRAISKSDHQRPAVASPSSTFSEYSSPPSSNSQSTCYRLQQQKNDQYQSPPSTTQEHQYYLVVNSSFHPAHHQSPPFTCQMNLPERLSKILFPPVPTLPISLFILRLV